MTTSTTIPIGELARLTGCNIETIRYYERIDVLPAPVRRGRYRRYCPGDVRRLAFVRRARELGFPIEAIRTLLTLAEGGAQSCQYAHDLAQKHLAEVRAKLADLERMSGVLDAAVQACERGDNSGCPLLETLANTMPAEPRRFPSSVELMPDWQHGTDPGSSDYKALGSNEKVHEGPKHGL
jgi:MerR family mercuric resistance operon transcriptional regulator